MVAQLAKPWAESKRLNRVIEVMKRNLDQDYVYTTKNASMTWGQQLKSNEVFIEIAQEDHEAFTNMTREIGVHIRDLHPNA
jgi:N-dimethylarginine dimethylaminohydrolase